MAKVYTNNIDRNSLPSADIRKIAKDLSNEYLAGKISHYGFFVTKDMDGVPLVFERANDNNHREPLNHYLLCEDDIIEVTAPSLHTTGVDDLSKDFYKQPVNLVIHRASTNYKKLVTAYGVVDVDWLIQNVKLGHLKKGEFYYRFCLSNETPKKTFVFGLWCAYGAAVAHLVLYFLKSVFFG